jgi:magnesium transporter
VRREIRFSGKKAGLPPGSLVRHGCDPDIATKVRVIDFSAEDFIETDIVKLEDLLPFKQRDTVTWIDIVGASRVDVLAKIGEIFGIHTLVLEDMLNNSHRPKMENYGEYLFFILKNIRIKQEELAIEQVSLLIGSNYILTFLDNDFDVFAPVRNRLRAGKGRIRKVGADYLGYALMDMIVDNYYIALEDMGERIEILEDDVLLNPNPQDIKRIQRLRTELLFVRKAVWPLREVIGSLERGDSEIFKPETQVFIRDVYDHAIQVIDTVETYREMVNGLMDIYLSSVSNRMNEVMKVLTIISTIFIPLTFLAGVEGMNFKYMPELEWEYGYPVLLIIMLIVLLGMIRFFRNKKWL